MKYSLQCIVCLLVLFISINRVNSQTNRPGIECGCDKYDDYTKAALATVLAPDLTTVQDGHSKEGTYQLEAVKTSAVETNVVIRTHDKMILNFTSRAGGWGFSPDEDRFVIYGVDQNNFHWYTLFNLNPDPTVEGEPAKSIVNVPPTDFSSAHISFSPHGKYLLHAAIGNALGNLVLYIYDAKTGDVVYHVNASNISGSPSGKSVGGWGFSPDAQDATFVHAYLTDPTHYVLSVKNLSSDEGDYVLHAINNTGGAYWRFSPCGDIFAWIFNYSTNSARCNFYKTNESDNQLFNYADAIGFKKIYTRANGHYIKYFNGSLKIFNNLSDGDCDDNVAPTWTGGSLLAEEITGYSITMSWSGASDNTGVVKYRIYQDGSMIKELPDCSSYTVEGLDESTAYAYKVEAGDATGNWSTTGPENTFSTINDEDPYWTGSEALDTTSVTGTTIKLEWDPASDDVGITGYRIYVNGKLTKTLEDTLTCSITGLIPATEYTMAVLAGDAAGQWTTDSLKRTISTKVDNAPVWPGGSAVTKNEITENTIDFSWTDASDDWNELYRYYIFLNKSLIDSVDHFRNTYLLEDLEEGTQYEIGIVATDKWGNKSDTLFGNLSTLAAYVVEPLIVNPALQDHPDIYQNLVVWEDYRNGNADIYMYNLDTDETTQITTNTSDQVRPRIQGNMIVWTDYRNGNADIYMYDLNSMTEVAICTDPNSQNYPDVWPPYIVWEDNRNGNQDIYMWDSNTFSESPVCTLGSNQMSPSVSGGKIVWEDYRNSSNSCNIYMYEIYLDQETRLSPQSSPQVKPCIYDRHVVWQERRGYATTDDIYRQFLYAFGSNWEFMVNADGELGSISNQRWANVDRHQIVFMDDRNGNWDIYAYKFNDPAHPYTGEFKTVCSEGHDQWYPRTDETRVVWRDERNDEGDIYIWDRPPGIDLQLSLTDSVNPVSAGDSIGYFLTVNNDGPDDASDVVISGSASAEIALSSVQGQMDSIKRMGSNFKIYLSALPYDSTIVLLLNYQTIQKASVSINAEVTADGFDPDLSNNKDSASTTVRDVAIDIVDEGEFAEMMVEDNGMVHLTYVKDDTLMYASKIPDSKWEFTKIGFVGSVTCSDMEMAGADTIMYAYGVYDYDTLWNPITSLHYMVFDTKGNIFDNEVVMESDSGFYSVDIEPDHLGNMHMVVHHAAYSGISTGTLLYFKKEPGKAFSSVPQRLATMYNSVDLEVDSKNNLHLAFYNIAAGGTNPLYMNNVGQPSGSWNEIEPIETNWRGGQMEGIYICLELDSIDNPQVFYVGSVNGDLNEDHKIAKKVDGTWQIRQVDEGYFASGENTMSKDANDFLHAFYYDRKHENLTYATNRMPNWIKQMIVPVRWSFTESMHVGADIYDKVHFSYQDGPNVCYAVIPGPQTLTLSDDSLNFGTLEVGESMDLMLSITNPNDDDVSIDSLVIEGADDYSVSKTQFMIAPGLTDTVTVTFKPVDLGIKNAFLHIYYGGPDMLMTDVILLGATNMPTIAVNPTSLAFGAVDLNNTKSLTLTVKNIGQENLEITDLEIKQTEYSAGPDDFVVVSNDCSTIIPGDSCEITVEFTPDHIEDQWTNLNIYSNDPMNEKKQVRMTGHVPRPLLGMVSQYVFEESLDPDSSITKTLYFVNYGDADLDVSDMFMTYTNASEFQFSHACDIVPVGDTCFIDVTFAPTYTGSKQARLYIYSNEQYSPKIVFLYGNCVSRSYEISDTILDFGTVNTMLDSIQGIWVKNTGTGPLDIEDITIAGNDSDDFEYSSDCSEVAVEDSCEIFVSFSPASAGIKTATMTIKTNAPEQLTSEIALSGEGEETSEPLVVEISSDVVTGAAPLVCTFTANVTGAVGMLAYNWDFGDGETATAPNPTHTYNDVGTYQVVLIVSEGMDRSDSDTLLIQVTEQGTQYSITGNSYIGNMGNQLTMAVAKLYKVGQQVIWDADTLVDSNTFSFNEIEAGSYIIKISPDKQNYPDGYDTYYGDVLFMAEATVLNLVSDTTGLNIVVQNTEYPGSGDGEIYGTLVEDETGKEEIVMKSYNEEMGTPIAGTDVYLLKSEDKKLLFAQTTDNAGDFDFKDIPFGNYIFATDYKGAAIDYSSCLIGVSADSALLEITAIISGGILKVEKNVMNDIDQPLVNETLMTYPNPVRNKLYIRSKDKMDMGRVKVDIVNSAGFYVKIETYDMHDGLLEIDLQDIPPGIYVIHILNKQQLYNGMFIKL